LLASRGISTVRDLLTFFPRAYEDRSRILGVKDLQEGVLSSVAVQVLSARKIPLRTGKTLLEVRCGDGSGQLALKWFHAPRGMESRLTPGTHLIATGVPKIFMGRPEILHPELSVGKAVSAQSTPNPLFDEPAEVAGSHSVGRVVPIYTELDGVPSRTFRKILWEALERYGPSLTDDLPEDTRARHGLPGISEAIRFIHFPEAKLFDGKEVRVEDLVAFDTPAHWRLVYEEFFKFEYLVLRQRLRMGRQAAPAIGALRGAGWLSAKAGELASALPFALTGDQQRALADILRELGDPHPMNRLVQGDVGSGKTAVALLAAGCAIADGGQAALMAPTEILAEQHRASVTRLLGDRVPTALLTGKTPASERARLFERLAAGEPLLLIGTHALLEDPVIFANLVLVMIDEQHRFGVEQRRTLRRKGTRPDPARPGHYSYPHTLILTATPIPRTLALTAYGDLAVSSIREMPPGRTPVITRVVRGGSRGPAHQRIREELAQGRQAYFIYPLVSESEAEGFEELKSAVQEAERLREVFPEFSVGLLHGKLRPDEKTAVMEAFKAGRTRILVSTTVVEVGVDVPNATVMAIEHAERFGLSQLHQLRGRVGRGAHQSYCFLFAASRTGEVTSQRLEVLEETSDGFEIAEADLKIRGPGEFLGTRQAGGLPFRLADLVRDRDWLLKARDDAQELLRTDPDLLLPNHLPLRRYYEREGKVQFERLKTS
jgi:ATP-dependent DNA helicase RecG